MKEKGFPKKAKKFIEEKLIPFILREQGNGFIMDDWIRPYTSEDVNLSEGELYTFDGVGHRVPSCGTVACIGGSVDFLQKVPRSKRQNEVRIAKTLGLNVEQARGLFYEWRGKSEIRCSWPEKFAEKFGMASTPYQKAKVAVALLREVIKTNGKCLNPSGA